MSAYYRKYRVKEFSELVDVSIKTLQRLDDSGDFKAFRTNGNQRFYVYEDIDRYIKFKNDRMLKKKAEK
jgi:DNA-binding transcriptional MerR regulator